MFKIPITNVTAEAVRSTLLSLSSNYIGKQCNSWAPTECCNLIVFKGRNYLVITTNPAEMLRIAGDLNMLDTGRQWLFLLSVTNTSALSTMEAYNVVELAASIREGGNVAFAVNSTDNRQCSVSDL